MTVSRRMFAVGLIAIVGASACNDDKASKPKTNASKPGVLTSSTTEGSSRTTQPSGPAGVLTGAPADAVAATRPALTVKVENTRSARPQTGLEFADVVYEEVCIRNSKHPILMDSNYTASVGKEKGQIPSFTGIVLRDVYITGGGKINLDGADEGHRLRIQFDIVSLDGAVKSVHAKHAEIKLGPMATNLNANGEDVLVTGQAGTAVVGACADRFVPFPLPMSQKQKR